MKPRDTLLRRRASYREIFGREDDFASIVMDDLERYCRHEETTFHPDQRVHAFIEGRRDVLLRIKQHLNLEKEVFLDKYKVKKGRNTNAY